MCVHNVDGQRGWNPECRDSGHCLCGYSPELEPTLCCGNVSKALGVHPWRPHFDDYRTTEVLLTRFKDF
jgi:hypothetical protein